MTTLAEHICPDCRARARAIVNRRRLADEIARAAVLEARGGIYWLSKASDAYWRWTRERDDRLKPFIWYARGLLDAHAAQNAPPGPSEGRTASASVDAPRTGPRDADALYGLPSPGAGHLQIGPLW